LGVLLVGANMILPEVSEAKPKAKPAQAANANWYPASVAAPNGLSYPCNLHPLPRSMDGIPARDRVYINHTFAMILRALQAKTVMLSKLTKGNARPAYATYYATTISALKTIQKEPTPRGLETFRNEVMNGIILQMTFFKKATTAAEAGSDFKTIMKIPEGKQASAQLQAAWSQLKSHYTNIGPMTENSLYHHLCALDLF